MTDETDNLTYKNVNFERYNSDFGSATPKVIQSIELGEINDSNSSNCTKQKIDDNFAEINNCLTTDEAIEKCTEILSQNSLLLAVHVDVDDDIEELNFETLSKACKKFARDRSILLIFTSVIKSESSLYWKIGGTKIFFKLNLQADKSIIQFVGNFLTCSLKNGHNGLLRSFKYDPWSFCINIELFSLGDTRNYNLLFLAAESGSASMIEYFIQFGFDIHVTVDDLTAADIAYKQNNFSALLKLLEANSLFPSNFDEKLLGENNSELKRFIEISKIMHESIKNNHAKNIDEIVRVHQNLRHFYDLENHSAITCALTNGRFEIFENLTIFKIFFGPKEDFDGIMDSLSEKEKRRIKKIHEKHSQSLMEKHIVILLANCSLGHDEINDQTKLTCVTKAFKVLNNSPLISTILKIVAASRNFKIIFDFKRESVRFLDPNTQSYTNGLFSESGRILIAARDLLSESQEHVVYGVLAHELCHFAMFIVFQNSAKPYYAEDSQTFEFFQTILDECERKKDKEDIVDVVYEYDKKMHHAELIVRVPHILAHYYNNKEKIADIRMTFGSLFLFFEDKVLPTLQKELPNIEGESEKVIKAKYLRAESKLSKIRWRYKMYFLTFFAFFPVLMLIVKPPEISWHDLLNYQQMHIKNQIVPYLNSSLKFNDLYPDDSPIYEELKSSDIYSFFRGTNDLSSFTMQRHFNFYWGNITSHENELLNSTVIFQGFYVPLSNITHRSSNVLYNISPDDIQKLLKKEPIKIGREIKDVKKYIERKFEEKKFNGKSYEFETINDCEEVDDSEDYDYENEVENVEDNNEEEFDESFTNNDELPQAEIILENDKTNEEEFDESSTNNDEDFTFSELPQAQIILENDKTNEIDLEKISECEKNMKKFIEREENKTEKLFKENFEDLLSEYEETEKDNGLTFDEVLKKGDQTIIISDNPGNGVSTIFKHFSYVLKEKYPNYWVASIYLGQHWNVFEEIKGECLNIKNISKLISSKLLKLKDVEAVLFEELFFNDQVIILWDGFNELCPTFEKYLISIFEKIYYKTDNLQIISTQPEYENLIYFNLRSAIYKISPLLKKDREKFLKIILKERKVSGSYLEEILNSTEKFVERNEVSLKDEDRSFNRPVMLKLLIDAKLNPNVKDFKNRFILFKSFIDTHLASVKCDKFEKVKISLVNPYRMHQIYALYIAADEVEEDVEKLDLFIKYFDKIKADLPHFELVRVFGKELKFLHKTYTEFFYAQFLIDEIYKTDKSPDEFQAELRVKILTDAIFHKPVVRDFILDYLKKGEGKIVKNFPVSIRNVLLSKFNDILVKASKHDWIAFKLALEFFARDLEVSKTLIQVWVENGLNIKRNNDNQLLENQLGGYLFNFWRLHKNNETKLIDDLENSVKLNSDEEARSKLVTRNMMSLTKISFTEFESKFLCVLKTNERKLMFDQNFLPIFFDELKSVEDFSKYWNFLASNHPKILHKNIKTATNCQNENILHIILRKCDATFVSKMLHEIQMYLNNNYELAFLLNSKTHSGEKPNTEKCKNSSVQEIFYKFRFNLYYYLESATVYDFKCKLNNCVYYVSSQNCTIEKCYENEAIKNEETTTNREIIEEDSNDEILKRLRNFESIFKEEIIKCEMTKIIPKALIKITEQVKYENSNSYQVDLDVFTNMRIVCRKNKKCIFIESTKILNNSMKSIVCKIFTGEIESNDEVSNNTYEDVTEETTEEYSEM